MGSERVTPPTLKEIFKSVFPYYLSIGMTYDQFWNDDVCLVRDYREAHKIQLKREEQRLWKQGAYFHDALGVVLSNAFSKGSRAVYPDLPYPATQKEAQERKKQEEQKRMERMQSMFNAYAIGLNQQLKEADNGHND